MANNPPITEFDMATVDSNLQIIKAMIPFLDIKSQRMFSMIIRIQEFNQTMNFYNSVVNINKLGTCANKTNQPFRFKDLISNQAFINSVLPYCPKEYADFLKNMTNFSKINEMMNLFNTFDTAENPAKNTKDSGLSGITGVLNPSQQKLYDDYLAQLDKIDFNKMPPDLEPDNE